MNIVEGVTTLAADFSQQGFSYESGVLSFVGGSDRDWIKVFVDNLGRGVLSRSILGSQAGFYQTTIHLSVIERIELAGHDGDDLLHVSDVTIPAIIDGGAGNDKITAGAGSDSLFGGDGNDLLFGQAGNDVMRGEAGDDYFEGGKGDETLIGDDGADHLFGLDGNDRFVTAVTTWPTSCAAETVPTAVTSTMSTTCSPSRRSPDASLPRTQSARAVQCANASRNRAAAAGESSGAFILPAPPRRPRPAAGEPPPSLVYAHRLRDPRTAVRPGERPERRDDRRRRR
jgi:hypothetical protein